MCTITSVHKTRRTRMTRVTLSIEYQETPGTAQSLPPISIQVTGTETQISARNPASSLVPRTARLNPGQLNWYLPNRGVAPGARVQTYRQVNQIRLSAQTANAITFFAEIFQTRVTGFSQERNGRFVPIHDVEMRNVPITIEEPRRLIGGRHYHIIVTNNHGRFSAKFTERDNRINEEVQRIVLVMMLICFLIAPNHLSRP